MFIESDVWEDKHLIPWPWEYVRLFFPPFSPIGRSIVQMFTGMAKLAACELRLANKDFKREGENLAYPPPRKLIATFLNKEIM